MLINENLEKYLFLDIEVVTQYKSYDDFLIKDPIKANLWKKRAKKHYLDPLYINIEDQDNRIYLEKAPFMPEFSKIITIGIGKFLDDDKKYIKILANDDEVLILREFNIILNKMADKILFGHNIQMFDNPFIIKRFIYNGFKIPKQLDNIDKKPWEVVIYDTLKLTQFGSPDMLSLDLLCESCGVESPKDDIDGSMVNYVYWNEITGLQRISDYNYKDINSMMDLAIYFRDLKNINE